MKKLALGFIAAALTLTGLGAAPAQAGPYAGSVQTNTIAAIGHHARVGQSAPVKIRVIVRSGNAKVSGKTQVRCAGPRGAFKSTRWSKYSNSQIKRTRTPTLTRRGSWKCKAYFSYGGVFRGSASTVHLTTVR